MLEPPDEREVHELRHTQRHQRHPDGRADVLARIEPRRQDLDQDEPDQPGAVCDHRPPRREDIVGAECAVMKDRRDQRHGEQGKSRCRRRREQQRQAQTPVEQSRVFLRRPGCMVPRQAGQEDRAQRNAQQSRWKLHQAVGVVEPGHASRDEKRREDDVDHETDLADRDAEHGRRHLPQDAPHSVILQVQAKARHHADAREKRQLEEELHNAAREDGPCERLYRRIEIGRAPQRESDEREVEQYWREGGHREAAIGVENAPGQRHKRDEKYVRKRDAKQLHRQVELFGGRNETGRSHVNYDGRGHDANQGHNEKRRCQRRGNMVDQQACGRLAALVLVLAKYGHEGLRKGALGKQASQQVGNLECDEKCVGDEFRPEGAGNDEVANQAQHPRDERHAAHPRKRVEQVHRPRPPARRAGVPGSGLKIPSSVLDIPCSVVALGRH